MEGIACSLLTIGHFWVMFTVVENRSLPRSAAHIKPISWAKVHKGLYTFLGYTSRIGYLKLNLCAFSFHLWITAACVSLLSLCRGRGRVSPKPPLSKVWWKSNTGMTTIDSKRGRVRIFFYRRENEKRKCLPPMLCEVDRPSSLSLTHPHPTLEILQHGCKHES